LVQFIGSIFLAGGIISRWGVGRGDWLWLTPRYAIASAVGDRTFLRLNDFISRKDAKTQRVKECLIFNIFQIR
jgi:hypothetical protein